MPYMKQERRRKKQQQHWINAHVKQARDVSLVITRERGKTFYTHVHWVYNSWFSDSWTLIATLFTIFSLLLLFLLVVVAVHIVPIELKPASRLSTVLTYLIPLRLNAKTCKTFEIYKLYNTQWNVLFICQHSTWCARTARTTVALLYTIYTNNQI